MNASNILEAAKNHLATRAKTYDKPEGERSMPATVAAFNALTGHSITAEQGWLFQVLLKAARSQQGGYKADNYEDGAAYFALAGEQAARDRPPVSRPEIVLEGLEGLENAVTGAFTGASATPKTEAIANRVTVTGTIYELLEHLERAAAEDLLGEFLWCLERTAAHAPEAKDLAPQWPRSRDGQPAPGAE